MSEVPQYSCGIWVNMKRGAHVGEGVGGHAHLRADERGPIRQMRLAPLHHARLVSASPEGVPGGL